MTNPRGKGFAVRSVGDVPARETAGAFWFEGGLPEGDIGEPPPGWTRPLWEAVHEALEHMGLRGLLKPAAVPDVIGDFVGLARHGRRDTAQYAAAAIIRMLIQRGPISAAELARYIGPDLATPEERAKLAQGWQNLPPKLVALTKAICRFVKRREGGPSPE